MLSIPGPQCLLISGFYIESTNILHTTKKKMKTEENNKIHLHTQQVKKGFIGRLIHKFT